MIVPSTQSQAAPSSTSAADAVLVVHLADRRFALPLADVERVMPMAYVLPLPENGHHLMGVLNLHGEILPVVDPRPRLSLPTPTITPEHRLVLVTASVRFLLWVDAIEEVVPGADALSTVPAQQTNPLVTRVMRLGESIVPVLAPSALAPRSGVVR